MVSRTDRTLTPRVLIPLNWLTKFAKIRQTTTLTLVLTLFVGFRLLSACFIFNSPTVLNKKTYNIFLILNFYWIIKII